MRTIVRPAAAGFETFEVVPASAGDGQTHTLADRPVREGVLLELALDDGSVLQGRFDRRGGSPVLRVGLDSSPPAALVLPPEALLRWPVIGIRGAGTAYPELHTADAHTHLSCATHRLERAIDFLRSERANGYRASVPTDLHHALFFVKRANQDLDRASQTYEVACVQSGRMVRFQAGSPGEARAQVSGYPGFIGRTCIVRGVAS